MEESLAAGRLTSARTMSGGAPAGRLSAAPHGVHLLDSPDGNAIAANYSDYFAFYSKWKSGRLSYADSLNLAVLAGKRPGREGAVVYQARNLLGLRTHRFGSYDDACFDALETRSFERRHPATADAQEYSLMPNPTTGVLQLAQAVGDDAPVGFRVYSSIGALVYSGSNVFAGRRSALQLATLPPGVYYLQLQDSQGRSFRLPFIKQ